MTKSVCKKNVALVFGITEEYGFALANTLIGLKKHNKKFWDDIIIYHDGLPNYIQNSIKKIIDVIFIDLSTKDSFKNIDKIDASVIKKYSVATFYRYECFNLLKDYHQVIWNDVDILIQGDISGLLDYGKKTGVAFSSALSSFVMASSLKKLLTEYNMFAPLWNVGIMVLTDNLKDYEKKYNWCIEATCRYGEKLLWPDLAVLNLMLQEFDIEPENIDKNKYVCLPLSENARDAIILHAYGDKKFWNYLKYLRGYPEWMENATEWSKIFYSDAKNDTPLVSCIMSCYERYDYLDESIASLLAQSYSNFEIIVVLEKSSVQKRIEKKLKEYKDDRIVIIKNEKKLGFPASLNVGINKAKGKYIARMDDDDISMPCRFEEQVRLLEKEAKYGIVGSDMMVFGREDSYAPTFRSSSYLKASTLVESPFKHPTVMMRKELLDKYDLRYDPDYYTEDYELWSRLIYLTEGTNISRPLVYYRSHSEQATGTNSNEEKIHTSHKRVMFNQFKKHLGLELTDNELEVLQTRKWFDTIYDFSGIKSLRNDTIKKIIEANDVKKVYSYGVLRSLLCDRKNGTYIEYKQLQEQVATDNNAGEVRSLRSVLKRIIKYPLSPIYNRMLDRFEKVMIKHDMDVQSSLQQQIDEIRLLDKQSK